MRGPNPSEYVSTRMPIRRASTRCPASWAAISSPRPTTATAMAMRADSIADAQDLRRNYVVLRTIPRGFAMRRMLTVVGSALLALACSAQRPAAKLDDSGLARLNESQMEPVDAARIEEGRAHDAVSRARANEADARARLEVAKSERGVADAQLKRALAERDLLKKQYADKDKLAEGDQEIAGAQGRIRATDLKLRYLEQMIAVAESERRLAEAHVGTAQALTERAKHRAMRAGNAPAAASAT